MWGLRAGPTSHLKPEEFVTGFLELALRQAGRAIVPVPRAGLGSCGQVGGVRRSAVCVWGRWAAWSRLGDSVSGSRHLTTLRMRGVSGMPGRHRPKSVGARRRRLAAVYRKLTEWFAQPTSLARHRLEILLASLARLQHTSGVASAAVLPADRACATIASFSPTTAGSDFGRPNWVPDSRATAMPDQGPPEPIDSPYDHRVTGLGILEKPLHPRA
jgi:hypothetical protein